MPRISFTTPDFVGIRMAWASNHGDFTDTFRVMPGISFTPPDFMGYPDGLGVKSSRFHGYFSSEWTLLLEQESEQGALPPARSRVD